MLQLKLLLMGTWLDGVLPWRCWLRSFSSRLHLALLLENHTCHTAQDGALTSAPAKASPTAMLALLALSSLCAFRLKLAGLLEA